MRRTGSAFTLIELLSVLAVMAVLLAILLPSLQGARRHVAVGRTQSQWAQWALAYEAFRSRLGHYPDMGNGTGEFSLAGRNVVFIETLTGAGIDGGPMTTSYARTANPGRWRFHAFTESAFAPAGTSFAGQLVDALGNPHLHVVIDHDLDGFVRPEQFRGLPPDRRPRGLLRGGVFFFTSNPEANPDWAWIRSWE